MSTNAQTAAVRQAYPAPSPGRPDARPQLQPVPPARARQRLSRFGFAMTSLVMLLVVLLAQLGLSIAVSGGAYEARALQTELKDLTRVERVLAQNTDRLASPQNLAENAAQLGMVQNSTPATIRLSDGAVLGTVAGATAAVEPNLVPNSALDGLPVVDASGLLVDRNSEQAEPAPQPTPQAPVAWDGALPAPQTH